MTFSRLRPSVRTIIAFMAAVIATAIVGSVVQTQVSLAALIALGVPVPWRVGLSTTLQDLVSFGSVMAAIAGASLLFALSAGHFATRVFQDRWRVPILGLAGVVGIWVGFIVMALFTPMPSLVAAARGPSGLLAMSLTGLIGGLVFAYLTSPRASPAQRRPFGWSAARWGVAAVLLATVPAVLIAKLSAAAANVRPPDATGYVVESVATGLAFPWTVAFLPDGRRIVTERAGRLTSLAPDGARSEISLSGLPPIHRGGGNGLMDMAVDPDFASNAFVYFTMSYGDAAANGTRLVRATLRADRIDDVKTLFESTAKTADGNNGGRIAFLRDGTLILSVGDGLRWREEAQNPANHLGKLVRLDRDGHAPADNPFVGRTGTASELFSIGHRNVQGVAVDPADGSLLISDHGPRGGDEINAVVAGANYGWPAVTGGLDYSYARVTPFRRLENYQAPLLEWTPSIAPAGLAVYDGALFPGWRGDLFVPALRERTLRRVIRQNGRIVGQELLLADRKERIRDVQAAPDGSLYVLTDGPDASLLRLVPAPPGGRTKPAL